jgi:hypothetical protein
MSEPAGERAGVTVPEFERAIEEAAATELPGLLGELERLRALAWQKMTAGTKEAAAPVDRAVGVEEACRLLAMTEDYVYRHWSKLGGYKDMDHHVKFRMSDLQRHIRHQARR